MKMPTKMNDTLKIVAVDGKTGETFPLTNIAEIEIKTDVAENNEIIKRMGLEGTVNMIVKIPFKSRMKIKFISFIAKHKIKKIEYLQYQKAKIEEQINSLQAV